MINRIIIISIFIGLGICGITEGMEQPKQESTPYKRTRAEMQGTEQPPHYTFVETRERKPTVRKKTRNPDFSAPQRESTAHQRARAEMQGKWSYDISKQPSKLTADPVVARELLIQANEAIRTGKPQDYAYARKIIDSILINDYDDNDIKAAASFLRGTMRFNGTRHGLSPDFRKAQDDFQIAAKLASNPAIKVSALEFHQVAGVMLLIQERVLASKSYAQAITEVKNLIEKIAPQSFNAALTAKIISIIQGKYPASDGRATANALKIPEAIIQELY